MTYASTPIACAISINWPRGLLDADALVLIRERTHITADLLDRLPRLKLIAQTGRGTAHIDVEACTARGIAVTAGSGSPYATAELTWALVLAAMRHSRRKWRGYAAGSGSTRSAPACAGGRSASSATAPSARLSPAMAAPLA